MMSAPKITFIGAGSTIFVKNILGDVFHREALKTAHIALMDIDPTRLEESFACHDEVIQASQEICMMSAPKITFICAGSTIFVKNILGDVFHREALKKAPIALMDIDPTRLAESHIVVRKLMDSAGASGKITCHTQQKEALQDADFVVVAFQIGGYEP